LPVSTPSSSAVPSPSPSSPPLPASPGLETITGWDNRGFPTTQTVVSGWSTLPKSYDEQGFLITTLSSTVAAVSTSAAGASNSLGGVGVSLGVNGKVVGTSTSKASAAIETARVWFALGLAAVLL
jgi:hypothetical protein